MLKQEIRPLCLSFWAPPVVRPQAILIGKMIPEWLRQGLEPVIITYETKDKWEIDAPLYAVPQFQTNRFLYRISPLWEFLKQRYYQGLFNIVKGIIKKHNLNLVFSFANPQDSNMLGAMLKDRLGIKFISHFSDPWYDNPFMSLSDPKKKIVLEQEKYIMKNSDRIVFINERLRQLVMKKYPPLWQKKAVVIPHSFDTRAYPAVQKAPAADKFTFSHIGSFYRQRNPEFLFQAFRHLLDRERNIAEKFRLKLIGSVDNYSDYSASSLQRLIKLYGLEAVIESAPQVSYEESLRQMKSSDCLIAIDADLPDSPCFPSKLVDYVASHTMILGIANHRTPVADFLTNLGYRYFAYGQTKELSDYLEKLVLRKVYPRPNEDYLRNFDIRVTTSRLIDIFKEV